jgi:hypothetical protein
VINSYAITPKMKQVPSNSAAKIKREAGTEPTDIPAIWALHIEEPFPPDTL